MLKILEKQKTSIFKGRGVKICIRNVVATFVKGESKQVRIPGGLGGSLLTGVRFFSSESTPEDRALSSFFSVLDW